jgi:hypothetical protein
MTPEEIQDGVRRLIEVTSTSLGVEVTTPVLYPNGDCISVVVAPEAAGFVAHDAGTAEMALATDGMRIDRARLTQIARRYDCDFISGRILRRCDSTDVPTSVALVANAIRGFADLASEARRQTEGQFKYVLTECVRDLVGRRLRENESFKGQSGTAYRVANVILNEDETAPVGFVVPLSSRANVASQFRELYDLKAAIPGVLRDSVYNDGGDFREEQDGWALRQVGELTPFSRIKIILPRLLSQAA